MTSRTLFKQEDIITKLAELNATGSCTTSQNSATHQKMTWILEGKELCCSLTFKDFREAFAFLTKVALVSEKLDHHATIHNTYNNVTLKLSTHTVEGITEIDFHWIQLLKAS